MTVIIFGRTLTFSFRNGCGIDLEFAEARAMWVSKDMVNLEVAAFGGVVLSLPFCNIMYGRCFQLEDLEI